MELLDHDRKERMRNVRHNHTEQTRAAGSQAAGQQVGRITECPGLVKHGPPCIVGHLRVSRKGLGHRLATDAQRRRNILLRYLCHTRKIS